MLSFHNVLKHTQHTETFIVKVIMSCCKDEIDSLSKVLENLTVQYKELKNEYQSLLVRNLEKDLIIDDLERKMAKYSTFEGDICDITLEMMRKLSYSKADDSAFVYLYLNDIYGASLKNKKLSGDKTPLKSNNSEISKKIKDKLSKLFDERLTDLQKDEVDTRRESLNKCIRNAIDKAKRGDKIYSNNIETFIFQSFVFFLFTVYA